MSTDKPRTLEQRLKFDLGLTVGEYHLVKFTLGERSVVALVEIDRMDLRTASSPPILKLTTTVAATG